MIVPRKPTSPAATDCRGPQSRETCESDQRERPGEVSDAPSNDSANSLPAGAPSPRSDQRERLGGKGLAAPNQHTTPPPAGAPSPRSDQRERLGGKGLAAPNQRTTPPPAWAPGPDLIPVRMLNEFAYCPRLGYLEFVHGEWEDNLETKQGTFGHRRVDQPDRQKIDKPDATELRESDRPEPDVAPVRSLVLSAPEEGLLAKLDLLELNGRQATPVDYKRGKAPKVPEGAYEPERVQLCAQGLILKENGFECDEGALYFIASKKRVVIAFTDELIARTRQLREEFGRVAAEDFVPPPLVDSPKCPRCSLVSICLPDEVVHLQYRNSSAAPDRSGSEPARQTTSNDLAPPPPAEALDSRSDQRERLGAESSASTNPPTTPPPTGAPGSRSDQRERLGGTGFATSNDRTTPPPAGAARPVRKLLPARDAATPFYVQENGAMLGKSGDRLQVKKKGELLGERRLKDVSQVSLFGSVIVSAQALSELMARGISICHLSHGGWFHGITTGLVHKNVQLRIRQYEAATHEGEAVLIARQLISGKIRNGRTFLRRHLGAEHKPLLEKLERYRRKAEAITSLESLLGIEGMAAKEYFSGLFELLRGRHDFDVNDRNRRPPRDPVNAVLSFAYALLTKELTVVLQSVGFDPMLGVFHQPRYGRPSLALDLAEEYRPLIADSVMLTAFNNGELSGDRFLERAGAVVLTPAGRAAVIAAFERRMTTEITHPIFGYRISYRRLLEVQSRLLARTLLGEIDQYPAFCTR